MANKQLKVRVLWEWLYSVGVSAHKNATRELKAEPTKDIRKLKKSFR